MKEALLQDLKDEEEEDRKKSESFAKPNSKPDKKAFHRSSDETPTYTGGVSEEARHREENRQNRDRQRRFQVTTKVIISIR